MKISFAFMAGLLAYSVFCGSAAFAQAPAMSEKEVPQVLELLEVENNALIEMPDGLLCYPYSDCAGN